MAAVDSPVVQLGNSESISKNIEVIDKLKPLNNHKLTTTAENKTNQEFITTEEPKINQELITTVEINANQELITTAEINSNQADGEMN